MNAVIFVEQELLKPDCLAWKLLNGNLNIEEETYSKNDSIEGIPRPERILPPQQETKVEEVEEKPGK